MSDATFGPFVFDPRRASLSRDGKPVALEKLAPHGGTVSRILGGVLVIAGLTVWIGG